MVHKPGHAELGEALVEELHPQLPGQQGHVLYDGEPHAPLAVLCQLHDGRQQALRQLKHQVNFFPVFFFEGLYFTKKKKKKLYMKNA